ncbi:uncharacterized protein ACHE_10926S [Aspergillus chevalieri]|uniref:Uncharacterized protein n=1 Tax=Aspergillus chevalieri TaxID=182096 RepID=A0A7R7ZJG7_ASPCH|nr:uncharacterized protein ACHE_10926S [Aspergillus chevalieri]BCR83524.1 hypothetical protein ACHE_10926S [Aspergillus chevalieri]
MSVPSSATVFIFRLGIYGLRNIDFLTETQTKPASKGYLTVKDNEFVNIIYHQPTTPLHVDLEWDALKISRLNCHTESNFGHDFLWVSPLQWAQLYPPSADSFYNWPRHYDFTRHSQRFMAYIPLHKDRFSLYGLTAFCSNMGLVGLGTHFCSRSHSPKTYWYGEQKGCPVHVQLENSETLSLLTVFWHRDDHLAKPYLIVTTSKQRTFTLGPCFAPPKIDTKNVFSESGGDILGLYYDKSLGITSFTSMGTVCRPRESSSSRTPNHSAPITRHSDMIYLLHTSPFGGFASQASLKNVISLKACYVGSRCKGMLLVYKGDTTCTLGQWYENTQAQPDVQEIYFQHDNVLRFHLMQGKGNKQFLARVESLPKVFPLDTSDKCIDMVYGDDIVWLFSEYSDIIFRGSEVISTCNTDRRSSSAFPMVISGF